MDLKGGGGLPGVKGCAATRPVLQLANPTRPYIVTTNASDFTMGAILSQVWDDGEHLVAYENRKMNTAKQNYPTHERELLVVIHALRAWRHYLLGKKFTIVSDRHSLKFI